jgi:putative membrane protein
MIKRYTDHSANERTYLAWIRTAVTVVAFGFLIEKFDLIMSHTLKTPGTGDFFEASLAVEVLGIIMFSSGIVITLISTFRFFNYKRMIESDEPFMYSVKYSNLFLSAMMITLSIFLLFYMIYEVEIDIHLGLR